MKSSNSWFSCRLSIAKFLWAFTAATIFASAALADTRGELLQWIEDNAGARKYTAEEAMTMLPPSPDPYRSIRPQGSKVNEAYWDMRRSSMAAIKAASMPPANLRVQIKKKKGTVIKGFGTSPNQVDAIDVEGSIDLPPPGTLIPNPEDEGSILLATPTNLVAGNAVKVSAVVGDGPLFCPPGTGLGDVDFYMIPNVEEGQVIRVDVDTELPFGALDPFVALWDEAGNLIAFNDDDGVSFDSLLTVFAPASGNYYVAITGFGTFITGDPFDSCSGLGLGSEGAYDATIGLQHVGEVELTFQLKKGDIFGASLFGSLAILSLADKTGLERQGSAQDVTFIHPAASPLPSGTAALSHVVDTTGNYKLSTLIVESGPFTISLRDFKNPLLSGDQGDVQTMYVDFSGPAVDVGKICYGIPPGLFVPTLSPLKSFLSNWGLTEDDEDAVIDSIMAHVHETLVADIDRQGREPTFNIRLLNSRDHDDPGDAPNTSRLVVGGTIDETGCPTIGIAESIDVGNFETSETAFVLLDLLSADASNPNSLNQFPRAPGVSIIEVIGAGVGNITSHEAGHILGNWHTDQFNDTPNIQDQGGNLAGFVGVGPDGIFGTADDVDVDFGRDEFVPNEGFTGIEDTLNSIAIGDPTPRGNNKKK